MLSPKACLRYYGTQDTLTRGDREKENQVQSQRGWQLHEARDAQTPVQENQGWFSWR